MKKLVLLLLLLLPVLATAQTEPKGAKSVRKELSRYMKKRQYNQVLNLAAKWHVKEQMGNMGMKPPQYIAELLGVHMVNNSIDAEDDGVDYSDLEQIKKIKMELAEVQDNVCRYSGTATLQDGSTLTLDISMQLVDGRWRLMGAVG